ncbi:HAD family hydrolase [Kineosporia mesophila]|uniref:HAD family hydrolase n=1 Tax=Kineosporia mesophila TaxID=566012 RepID=A0ABP6Z927_9ACTN|nr:HAD-IA family hydrolase [Kineosporia mesophila]MCD5352989.1 HAD-IA family hydrolase [Kineosporia mesophila]
MPALLFGSISTLADTSELQRLAFNQAFAEHGLDWQWTQEEYRSLLGSNGGADRVREYARSRGENVDAAAVHATKSDLFRRSLASSPVVSRPGVVETIAQAKESGYRIGFVTTTSGANVQALLTALAPGVSAADFDVVVDASDVETGKPDPAAYRLALDKLGVDATACVAIEDNPGGARSAAAAGIACAAFPNENTRQQDFGPALPVGEELRLEELRNLIPAA